ncbi:hypothetical protein EVAR_2250_1 [Eumeta japonica]|uniref:Uncharacterized protein n=1 Tax=Eumeta variegata TaxID=151549 RepID=A0A4C1SGC0_EUMVA|nr:hypothetical protein EVAR_2250_1 [Eumeta japonica]
MFQKMRHITNKIYEKIRSRKLRSEKKKPGRRSSNNWKSHFEIEQDIGLGKAVGFKTLLVLTSNDRATMMKHEELLPDFCADSLGDLVPQLSKAAGK